MRVKDLKIGEMYFSKSHKLVMKYCGVEYFRGRKYHNFYDASWKLFHWLHPQDIKPHITPSDISRTVCQKSGESAIDEETC